MFQNSYNIKALFTKKYIVTLLPFSISLATVVLYDFVLIIFIREGGVFPITFRGMESMNLVGDFSDSERIVRSILWYTILLGVFVTIPIYIKKHFENPQFYKYYKRFWWGGGLIFGILTEQFCPAPISIVVVIITLVLTLAPAFYQNNKKRNSPD